MSAGDRNRSLGVPKFEREGSHCADGRPILAGALLRLEPAVRTRRGSLRGHSVARPLAVALPLGFRRFSQTALSASSYTLAVLNECMRNGSMV